MFFDVGLFPFTRNLEANWRTIREEYARLEAGDFIDWPETDLYNNGWQVCGFYFFGENIAESLARCPQTAELLSTVPGLTTAGFSVMAPGAHIKPHTGYTTNVVRCHLGLVVPEGCTIRVGNDIRPWGEGRCLIFDDTIEHEAWNRSSTPRAILLLDIERRIDPAVDVKDHIRPAVADKITCSDDGLPEKEPPT